ncbi:MAG: NAD(P)/FAD-dependent oxidoreductase, partial [Paracoccaceae bacterium]
FLGTNPHFHKSALSRYTPWDFLDLVNAHGIAWHEKAAGQLFCDGSARQIVRLLLDEAAPTPVWLSTRLVDLRHDGTRFVAELEREGIRHSIRARNLILATGGKSIPKMGATGLAYDIAQQFGHQITDTRPGLVPFTFPDGRFKAISGVATPVRATADGPSFDDALLFTHRGISGPAILQISSYWQAGRPIHIDLLPDTDLTTHLHNARKTMGKRQVGTWLSTLLPDRLVAYLADTTALPAATLTQTLGDLSRTGLETLDAALHHWRITPQGTEGYRTAEVTLGGIATDGIDSKTLMSRHQSGLYMVGEAVDVTGWLGGHNFQWAWASGAAAGRAIAASL